jgi:hypothetical protein
MSWEIFVPAVALTIAFGVAPWRNHDLMLEGSELRLENGRLKEENATLFKHIRETEADIEAAQISSEPEGIKRALREQENKKLDAEEMIRRLTALLESDEEPATPQRKPQTKQSHHTP